MSESDIHIPDEALEAAAKEIYNILEGPIANQDYGRQVRQWELAQSLARAAIAACRPIHRAVALEQAARVLAAEDERHAEIIVRALIPSEADPSDA